MSLTKRIFNNVSWLVLSEIGSKILIFLGTIYLARVLGKAGFGLYSLSLAVGVYFWVAADIGVSGYGVREIAQNKGKAAELYNTLNSLRLVLAISLFLIFLIVLYLINIPLEKKFILAAGSFYSVAYSLSSDWVFRGVERMEYLLFGYLATALVFLLGIYLLVNTPLDTFLASVIYSSSFLIGSLIFLVLLRRKFKILFSLRVSFTEWWVHIKEAFYFAVNGVFVTSSIFIPIFFMAFWSTHEDLGVFSAPHKVTIMVIKAGALIILALYPTLSSLYVTDRGNFKKTYIKFQKLIIGIAMPVCIIIAILSKDIIRLLFGVLYADSVGIFNILIWFTFLTFVRRGFGIALLSAGFHRFNMLASGAGTAVVTLSSIVMIPRYSGYGAAWALIGGEICALVLMSGLFRNKIFRLDLFKPYFVKVLLASTLMGLIIISLPFSTIISALIGVLIYFFLSFSIGIVSKKTIQQVYQKVVK